VFRNARLAIPPDFEVPTCDQCGAEWLDHSTAKRLNEVLEGTYRRRLTAAAKRSLSRIREHTSQRALEVLLGLSQGYLSKLLSGKRAPSAELVAGLVLVARDPKRRLSELGRFWTKELAEQRE
jgi:hypothetical protein